MYRVCVSKPANTEGAAPVRMPRPTVTTLHLVYFTDRGIEALGDQRGTEKVTLGWLADRLREFVDLNPEFEVPVDRLAMWLAQEDDEE